MVEVGLYRSSMQILIFFVFDSLAPLPVKRTEKLVISDCDPRYEVILQAEMKLGSRTAFFPGSKSNFPWGEGPLYIVPDFKYLEFSAVKEFPGQLLKRLSNVLVQSLFVASVAVDRLDSSDLSVSESSWFR